MKRVEMWSKAVLSPYCKCSHWLLPFIAPIDCPPCLPPFDFSHCLPHFDCSLWLPPMIAPHLSLPSFSKWKHHPIQHRNLWSQREQGKHFTKINLQIYGKQGICSAVALLTRPKVRRFKQIFYVPYFNLILHKISTTFENFAPCK